MIKKLLHSFMYMLCIQYECVLTCVPVCVCLFECDCVRLSFLMSLYLSVCLVYLVEAEPQRTGCRRACVCLCACVFVRVCVCLSSMCFTW